MTEQALLVKSCTSLDGRYYAIGLNSPHVRIFDTARGALCAHIDLAEKMAADKRAGLQSALSAAVATTYHDRAVELAAVRDITLTAVHIAAASSASSSSAASGAPSSSSALRKGTAGDVDETSQICVAGFSNGTVIAVRLADDAVLYHVAVSDTQQPAIAFASTGEYLFVLCANRQLHVIDAATGARRVLGIPVPANTTTVAVYAPAGAEAGRVDVLLCGTTTLCCSLHVPTHRSHAKMDVLVPSLGGSSAPTTHAFIGSTLADGRGPTNIGITCAASEGVVRVWDLSPATANNNGSSSTASRCRRILPCNHRVASMSVRPERGVVSVTTFAGQILVWNFTTADGAANTAAGASAIIGRAGDAFAQPATIAITSTSVPSNNGNSYKRAQQLHRAVVRGIPTRKILDACLIPSSVAGDYSASSASKGGKGGAAAAGACSLVIVRGKYAMPSFDGAALGPVFGSNLLGLDRNDAADGAVVGSNDPQHHLYLTAPGLTVANSPIGPNLSFNPHEGVVATSVNAKAATAAAAAAASHLLGGEGADGEDMDEDEEAAAVAAFELRIGAGWATHSADAHRAMVTSTEEFSSPTMYQAASMKELPTGGVTAKEADKALARVLGKKKDKTDNGDAAADEAEAEEALLKGKKGRGGDMGALGLAVIPLYQALHANDKALVMELVTLASRSQADIIATVRKLALPYALQLFSILSERLVALGQMDHPFHAWVAAILQARGVEMLSPENARVLQSKGCSHPKQFIAALRNNYSAMLETQDRLAVLYGRLSIFNAVKPRADAAANGRNTHATIRKGTVGADPAIFPNCFKEVVERPQRARGGGLKRSHQTVADATDAANAAANTQYNVVRVSAQTIAESTRMSRKSTAMLREEKREARRAETKRKRQLEKEERLAARKSGGKGKSDADDVYDEADEDEMMDHLDEMNLDDSDDDDDDIMGGLDGMNLDDSDDEEGEEADENGSLILEGEEDEEGDDDDSEASSADEADNLLDSEDELADGDDEEESDDDEEDNEDDGGDGSDSDDDLMDADFNADESGDDSDRDSADDVEEAIRGEHEMVQRTNNNAERKKNRRMRTD